MVTVTPCSSRSDIAEAMAHMTRTTAAITRRGHDGTHKGCSDCERYAEIHANLDALLSSWQKAGE